MEDKSSSKGIHWERAHSGSLKPKKPKAPQPPPSDGTQPALPLLKIPN